MDEVLVDWTESRETGADDGNGGFDECPDGAVDVDPCGGVEWGG